MENPSKSPSKVKYKVANWKAYNASLKKRGGFTLWIEEKLLRDWRGIDVRNKVVGEKIYPDSIIEFCLVIGSLYHQRLRQTIGLVESILTCHGLSGVAVPNFSTLSGRAGSLPVLISPKIKQGKTICIGADSTGLKVFGEGEWKVRKHGAGKRRVWKKMHIAIDLETNEIVNVCLTGNKIDDAKAAVGLLSDKKEQIKAFYGDGAYDDFEFRAFLGKDIAHIIPPPCDAVEHKPTKRKTIPDYLEQRNKAVVAILTTTRKEWKISIGYHKRSLNETVMFRYKATFGGNLHARSDINQETEVKIKCNILNRFTRYGRPKSQKI